MLAASASLSAREDGVLGWRRAALLAQRRNKARRGELFTCVPIGYVRSATGGITLETLKRYVEGQKNR